MSALYGTVIGQARTAANRRGSREVTVAARSWDGSVTVTMRKATKDSPPEVSIEVSEGSKVGGREVWRGPLASLMLQGLLNAPPPAHAVSVLTGYVAKCGKPGCTACDETSEEYMARKG